MRFPSGRRRDSQSEQERHLPNWRGALGSTLVISRYATKRRTRRPWPATSALISLSRTFGGKVVRSTERSRPVTISCTMSSTPDPSASDSAATPLCADHHQKILGQGRSGSGQDTRIFLASRQGEQAGTGAWILRRQKWLWKPKKSRGFRAKDLSTSRAFVPIAKPLLERIMVFADQDEPLGITPACDKAGTRSGSGCTSWCGCARTS